MDLDMSGQPIGRELNKIMHRYELQPILFGQKISRIDLQSIEPQEVGQSIHVKVWRNHAFEAIAGLMQPFVAFGGWSVRFTYSDYDDSLLFQDDSGADVNLIWIDSSRYLQRMSAESWRKWLVSRIEALRAHAQGPILIGTWLGTQEDISALRADIDKIPAAFFCDLSEVSGLSGVDLLDTRITTFSGSPVSSAAQAILARELACKWLPGAIFSPIKAIALDLDNTLYRGVLGEDGVDGVVLTKEHWALQTFLKELGERGVFLALVSRNELTDVKNLFEKREDFPLKWSDFSSTEISWGEKASAIVKIASSLRISPDAILFIDDNPGELASVVTRLDQLHTIHANTDASLTKRTIEYYPRLWRWRVGADDGVRIRDLKANAERESLLVHSGDLGEYFSSLQVKLHFCVDPYDKLGRLGDLCIKTNQFNLSLQRSSEVVVADRLTRLDACVVSVQLADRLSDSGVIAVIVAMKQEGRLLVEEICISCRALGRHLEDTIVLEAIRQMPLLSSCEEIVFQAQLGPRNQPALRWLASLLETDKIPTTGLYPFPVHRIFTKGNAPGVTITKG